MRMHENSLYHYDSSEWVLNHVTKLEKSERNDLNTYVIFQAKHVAAKSKYIKAEILHISKHSIHSLAQNLKTWAHLAVLPALSGMASSLWLKSQEIWATKLPTKLLFPGYWKFMDVSKKFHSSIVSDYYVLLWKKTEAIDYHGLIAWTISNLRCGINLSGSWHCGLFGLETVSGRFISSG